MYLKYNFEAGKKIWNFAKLLLSCLLFTCHTTAIAQRDSSLIFISASTQYGFILPHSSELKNFAAYNPWGLNAELSQIKNTQSSWGYCNCYSRNGFSISYINFGFPKVLGSKLSLALFAEPQLIRKEKFRFGIRGAMGLSYLSKIHHPDRNPENIFFSTHLSGLLQLQLRTLIHINDHWNIDFTADFNHISNGGSKQPNKGMNFLLVGLGAIYSPQKYELKHREKQKNYFRGLKYYTGLSYNTRKISSDFNNPEGRKMVIGLQAGMFKVFAPMHAVGMALEAAYDGSLKERFRQNAEDYDHRILSALLRHHFIFGRFDFSQAMGFYLYSDLPSNRIVFQRYAIQYGITKYLQAGFSLKAHGHVAEQMDLRMMLVF